MNKKFFYLLNIFILFIIIYFSFCTISYCAYPGLISRMSNAFEKIKSWLIKLSTPAAAVAVGTGVFIKKFSFGDEERIVSGKKLIRSTLFSYAFILSVDLVLKAIESLFGK